MFISHLSRSVQLLTLMVLLLMNSLQKMQPITSTLHGTALHLQKLTTVRANNLVYMMIWENSAVQKTVMVFSHSTILRIHQRARVLTITLTMALVSDLIQTSEFRRTVYLQTTNLQPLTSAVTMTFGFISVRIQQVLTQSLLSTSAVTIKRQAVQLTLIQ